MLPIPFLKLRNFFFMQFFNDFGRPTNDLKIKRPAKKILINQ